MRRALAGLVALLVAWLIASGFLFLWPGDDAVTRADAVVVLAGDAAHRIPRGLELVEDDVADELLLSREPGSKWERWRRLCSRRSVVCFQADPYSTAGEAEAVARIAERRRWRSIAVVTSRYHIVRSRILFRRCYSGRVSAVAAEYERRWLPLILPLETAKLVRALVFERSC